MAIDKRNFSPTSSSSLSLDEVLTPPQNSSPSQESNHNDKDSHSVYTTSFDSEEDSFHNSSPSPTGAPPKDNMAKASSSKVGTFLVASKARTRRLNLLMQESLKKKKANTSSGASSSEYPFVRQLAQQFLEYELEYAVHSWTVPFAPTMSFTLYARRDISPALEADRSQWQLFLISGYVGTTPYSLIQRPWAFIVPWSF